jgi:tRNA pseudouridine38-40 synthase
MRYFLEVSYKGTNYSGFQSQKNANTIQDEIENAFLILLKQEVRLTGSSRTDAGVHAIQNYFHFDSPEEISAGIVYNLNSILPFDIVVKKIIKVKDGANCRFDALSREYKYYIYQNKNPFLKDTAYYYPYILDVELLKNAASVIKDYANFTSFSKRNTQVKTFECRIIDSNWNWENECLIYQVKADRFLRGMVRALTATMLNIGRGKTSLNDFRSIIEIKDCTKASFAAPAHGLQLTNVQYPVGYFGF